MKNDFLLSAFTDIRDDFIMEAEKTMTKTKKKLPWKALLIAALIPILTVTAYASDFLNVKSLLTGTLHFSSSQYSDMAKAEKKAGFELNAPETLEDYTFREVQVQDVNGLDEEDRQVLKYREASISYENPDGNPLFYGVHPIQAEIPASDRAADQVREVNGVKLEYRMDCYWFLPASYEETGLTQEMKDWEKLPGHHITYGSDEPEQENMGFLTWERDGLRYSLLDMDGVESPDTLFAMASQLMTK